MDFTLNSRLKISQGVVGRDREPVFFIDDVLADPDAMVAFAAQQSRFEPAWTESGGYPGVRGSAPLGYTQSVVHALGPMIAEAFKLGAAEPRRADCYLSLVTRAPQELTPMQRIPHIDTVSPMRIALLHYFCNARFGGTAFYRHRATGFETIDESQEAEYLTVRDQELAESAPADGYLQGSTPRYEQLDAVQCRFNRLLIYRSRLLHCGVIPDDMIFSTDPRQGRLTANIFVDYEK